MSCALIALILETDADGPAVPAHALSECLSVLTVGRLYRALSGLAVDGRHRCCCLPCSLLENDWGGVLVMCVDEGRNPTSTDTLSGMRQMSGR